MSQDTQQLDLINELVTILKDTKDFVLTEAPEVVQQLLLYKQVECTVIIVSLLACSILWYNLTFRWLDQEDSYFGGFIDNLILASVLGAVASPVVIFVFFMNLLELIKIAIAPKLYMLEYLVNLL